MIPDLLFLSLPDNVIASTISRVGISLGASVKAVGKNINNCQHENVDTRQAGRICLT